MITKLQGLKQTSRLLKDKLNFSLIVFEAMFPKLFKLFKTAYEFKSQEDQYVGITNILNYISKTPNNYNRVEQVLRGMSYANLILGSIKR